MDQSRSSPPEDLIEIDPQSTMIKMDFKHKPLPDIPLPNDIATRYDPHSATKRRVNASMIAPTLLESQIREKVDQIDGWGVNQPITIPFTKALDLDRIIQAHRCAWMIRSKSSALVNGIVIG